MACFIGTRTGLFCGVLLLCSCGATTNLPQRTVNLIPLSRTTLTLMDLNGMDAVHSPAVRYAGDTAIVSFERSMFGPVQDKVEIDPRTDFIKCEGLVYQIVSVDVPPYRSFRLLDQ